MTKYTESDLLAMSALMNFGSSGQALEARKVASGVTSYLPSDQEQFARLMAFDRPTSKNSSAYSAHNAPVPPPLIDDGPRTEEGYTSGDQKNFDRIVMGIADNSVFKSPNLPKPAADDVSPKYEARDLAAFAALGGVSVTGDDKAAKQPAVKAAPRYTPPQRPAPKEYFAIKVVDADAERGKERLYFSAERPAMKIVFSDANGKKR